MIQLGKHNHLTVYSEAPQGLYLGDDEVEDILLPNKYVPEETEIGDELIVFVYKDSEDRIIATTLRPKILLYQFAYLQVRQVNRYGAFLDWGLEKDLMVPFKEQAQRMQPDQSYVVFLYKDELTDRLVASSRTNRFLKKEDIELTKGEKVNLLVEAQTDLGWKVIIDNQYSGLIFKNEVFQTIHLGDRLTGFVKNIREDNKIDVVLQQQGFNNIQANAQKILDKLKANEGYLSLTDKSPPSTIVAEMDMSKKTFKKAVGTLYKKRLIRLEKNGIYLNEVQNEEAE